MFGANEPTTREWLVTLFYNYASYLGIDVSASLDIRQYADYNDISDWARSALMWAIAGYGNRIFGLNDPVTREQTVAILYRYAKAKGLDVSTKGNLSGFIDADAVSGWALEALQWAVAEGVVQGLPGNKIAPQGSSTRAEIATILMRFIKGFPDKNGTPGGIIVLYYNKEFGKMFH